MSLRIAIAQISMHWTTEQNMASIREAIELAERRGANLCAFSELALTGFHRGIGKEARPEVVDPAVDELCQMARAKSMAIAVGAPTFGPEGAKYNSHVLISESGIKVAVVSKRGLTDPEATFFARGPSRPIGLLQGVRCSAVICREVSDLELVAQELPIGSTDLIFVPGALRQDPDKPLTDPPAYVHDIRRLAAGTGSTVVHTNWPNALNRPEESVDGGGSTVASAGGQVLFRLPMQESGVAVFNFGEAAFEWHAQ